MEKNLVNYCSKAIDAVKNQAEDVEAYAVDSVSRSVKIENNKIKLASSETSAGLGIRIFKNKAVGFASTNLLNPDEIALTAGNALKIAKAGKPEDANVLPEKTKLPSVSGLYDPRVAEVDIAGTLEFAKALLGKALSYDKRVTIDGGGVDVGITRKAIANSRGVLAEEISSIIVYHLMGMARDGEDVSSFHVEFDAHHSLSDVDVEKVGLALAQKVVATLGATKGESFNGQALFSPDSIGSLLCSPVIFSASAENVQKGQSRFVGKIGQKVASELLTMSDNGLMEGGIATSAFDREGVAHAELPIIKNGVLQNFLYDTRTAHREKKLSTGHASGGTRGIPGIGPTNITITPGNVASKEIISNIKQGILVNRFSGWPNPISGDFSGVVKGGFLIKNGEIAKPVTGTLIQGNMFELMQNVSKISSDTKTISNYKLPYVLVEGISVTSA